MNADETADISHHQMGFNKMLSQPPKQGKISSPLYLEMGKKTISRVGKAFGSEIGTSLNLTNLQSHV